MAWDFFVQVSGVGIVLFLNLLGGLALVLPGRADPLAARSVGLGRHVEGLLILALAATVYRGGIGNVPVYIDRNGVVAFSLIGAVLPVVLSLHFLARAGGVRASLALVGTAGVAFVAFYVSAPASGEGIVAKYPYFLLPSVAAALVATLLAPGSLRAVPIAYACGSLGALIGGDLVRFDWVLKTQKPIAGSFGGAEVFDLVFLAGLWGAAFAALPLVPYWSRLRRASPTWEPVARAAAEGRTSEALRIAVRIVEGALGPWAAARGLGGRALWEVRALSFAEPVLGRAEDLMKQGPFPNPAAAEPILVQLEALHRRLGRSMPPAPATVRARSLAGLLDLLPPLLVAGAAILLPTAAPFGARVYFAVTAFVATHVLYPFASEWMSGGRTLGKALMGLRVRNLDGSPLGMWASLVRNLGRLLDLPLFYIIAVAAPAEAGRQRLGDYFAGTVVMDERATKTIDTARPTPMPTLAIQTMDPMNRAPR